MEMIESAKKFIQQTYPAILKSTADFSQLAFVFYDREPCSRFNLMRCVACAERDGDGGTGIAPVEHSHGAVRVYVGGNGRAFMRAWMDDAMDAPKTNRGRDRAGGKRERTTSRIVQTRPARMVLPAREAFPVFQTIGIPTAPVIEKAFQTIPMRESQRLQL